MIDEKVLLEAIETSLFLYPELPGRIERLSIPGIQGRVSSTSHPVTNMVGASTLTADTADATIRQVCDIFSSRKQMFSWLVGPSSTPKDLPDRLSAAGFVKAVELLGLAKTDLRTPIKANPEVRVRQITMADRDTAISVLTQAFPSPEDVSGITIDAYMGKGRELNSRNYLAYVGDKPVAFANMITIPGTKIVQLCVAATFEEHRGRGVYTSLLSRRLADAASDGAEAVVIQAARTTSAPICKDLGFVELCDMALYARMPEAAQSG